MPDRPAAVDLGHALTLPPAEAVAYFRGKGRQVSTRWWQEVWQEAHAHAATIAGMAREDLLRDTYLLLDRMLESGMAPQEAAQQLAREFARAGWLGPRKGEKPKHAAARRWQRVQTIVRTNARTAFAAGRFQRQQDAAERPYWQYLAVLDGRTRDRHRELHGLVFRSDDPIWDIIYPPNGFNCRCRVRALTLRQVRARGLKPYGGTGARPTRVTSAAPVEHEFVDKATGEIFVRRGTRVSWRQGRRTVEFQPDPGWSYNPGRQTYLPPQKRPGGAGAPAVPDTRAMEIDLEAKPSAAARQQYRAAWKQAAALPADVDGTSAAAGAAIARARKALAGSVTPSQLDERMRAAILRADPGESAAAAIKIKGHAGAVAMFRRLVDPSLLRNMPTTFTVRQASGVRAHAQRRSATAAHVTIDKSEYPHVVVHELGHVVEFTNDDVLREAAEFIRRRNRRVLGQKIGILDNEPDVTKQYVTGMGRWDSKSAAPEAHWQERMDRYAGRIYWKWKLDRSLQIAADPPPASTPKAKVATPVAATEVISVGLEKMARAPGAFAMHDWEYFSFILRRVIWRNGG